MGGREPRVFVSSLPGEEAFHLLCGREPGPAWVGDRPFPHWLAADLARQAREALASLPPRGDKRRFLRAAVRRRLRRWGRPADFHWEPLVPRAPPVLDDSAPVLTALRGRLLYAAELELMLKRRGWTGEVEPVLAGLAARGLIEAHPAVEVLHFGRAVCRRCGETDLAREDCWFCGDRHCWTCPSCSALGPSRGCRTLYGAAQDTSGPPRDARPVFAYALTPAQERAAASLREFLAGGRGGDFLVWAVCGAGKTEVILEGMAPVVACGGRVLLATPRREIAAELAGRVAAALPGLPMAVHYGGRHEEPGEDAAVTVATTHQCLRFYRGFDLAVLDEVDAFPFHGSRMLYDAVWRARRPGGRVVYLTATPPPALAERLAGGSLPFVRLPVRPHGHPLPVPELVRMRLGEPGPGWRLPAGLAALWESPGRRPGLVFVPSVAAASAVGRELVRWGAARGIRTAFVHAADAERERKRAAFVQGRCDLLVTTTLLERGLTLGALDVYVLFADCEAVFDAACLIQMAGRAGRLADDPAAKVLLIGERLSPAMRAARQAVMEANEEAARGGFLTGAAP